MADCLPRVGERDAHARVKISPFANEKIVLKAAVDLI
jgi:hypothetical protein